MEASSRRNPLVIVFAVAAVLVVVGGLLLGFFGIGAELATPRTIRVTIRNRSVDPRVVARIKRGDPVFTDTAGILIGHVTDVVAVPQPTLTDDTSGTIHVQGDPTSMQVDTTFEARGRVGNGLVVLDTQVVQAGQSFNLISNRYYLSGSVVSVDVR